MRWSQREKLWTEKLRVLSAKCRQETTHLGDYIVCLNRMIHHSPHDQFYLCVLHVPYVPQSPELMVDVKPPDITAFKTAFEVLLCLRVSPISIMHNL